MVYNLVWTLVDEGRKVKFWSIYPAAPNTAALSKRSLLRDILSTYFSVCS